MINLLPLTKDGAKVVHEREQGLVLVPANGVVVRFALAFTLRREIAGEFVSADIFGDGAIDRRHGLCLRPPNFSARPSCLSEVLSGLGLSLIRCPWA